MAKNLFVKSKSPTYKLLFAVISLFFLNLHVSLGQIKEDTYYITASVSSSGNGTALEKAYMQVSSLNGLHDTTLWMQWNSAAFNFNPGSSEGGTFAENLGAFFFYDDYYYTDYTGFQPTIYSTIPTVVKYNKGQYLYTGYVCNEYGTRVSTFQLNVDDPVYLTGLAYSGDISDNNVFWVSQYYDNSNIPEFQYICKDQRDWNQISGISLPPAGGDISVNLLSLFPDASCLYTKDYYFRAVKTLSDSYATQTYGNILGPFRFYDIPTITIPTTSSPIKCVGESITFTGGYVHFPTASPDAGIEVKLSSDPDDSHWRSVPGVLTNTGLSLSYNDIAAGNNWQGQEIQIRATRMFNGTQKITSDPIRILFLPVANLSFTHSNILCAGDHNATITLTCNSIPSIGAVNPETGSPIPLTITIKEYGNQKWAQDVTYDSVKFNGNYYYYANGRTIQGSYNLTGTNSITLTESSFGGNFNIGAGIYTIWAQFNTSTANCPKSDTFEIKEPLPANFYAQAVKLNGTEYSIKTGQTQGTVRFNYSGGTPPYYHKLYPSGTPTEVSDNGLGGSDSYGRPIGQGKDSILANAGTWMYNLYDFNGCKTRVRDTITLTSPQDITITPQPSDTVSCNNSDIGDHGNGAVIVTLNGGISPYTAKLFRSGNTIDPLPVTPDISGSQVTFSGPLITKDSYIVKVSDNLNTTYDKPSTDISVPEPEPLGITATGTNPTCSDGYDGSFILNTTGGKAPYKYTLDNIVDTFKNYTSGNPRLPVGNFTITATDDNTCSNFITATLSRIPLIVEATYFKPASCATVKNATVRAVVTNYRNLPTDITFWGAFGKQLKSTYNSTEGAFYLDSLASSASMSITVKDALCSAKDTVYIPVRQPGLTLHAITSQKAPCAGKPGTISIAARNGELPNGTNYQFSIDEDAPQSQTDTTINYILEGNSKHNFTITDGVGCTVTGSNVNVDVISNYLRLNQSPETMPGACASSNTGSVTVHKIAGTGIGSIDFNLTETDATLSDTAKATFPKLIPRPYNIVATDTKGCKDSVSLVLGVSPDSLALSFFNIKKADCNGGSPTGEIMVTRTVAGKKTGFGDVTFIFKSPVKADTVYYTGLISGLYTITAYDTIGCIATISDSVRFKTNPVSLSVVSKTDQTCNEVQNAQIKLKAATTGSGIAGFKFILAGDTTALGKDSITYNLKVAGAYRFSVLDQNNCGNTRFDTIHNLLRSPKPILDLSSPVACSNADNGALTIHNSPNGSVPTYKYSLGSTIFYTGTAATQVSFQNLHKGNYTIYAKDTLGCTDTAKFAVKVESDSVHIAKIDTTSSSCVRAQNGKARIIASSSVDGNTYSMVCNGITLLGDTVTFKNLPVNEGTSHLVTVTDKHGCANSQRFAIGVILHPLNLSFTSLVNTNCPGTSNGKITLSRTFGDPIYRFNIQTSAGSKTFYNASTVVTIPDLPSDVYNISVTDTVNCMAEVNNITLAEPEQVNFLSTYNNYIKRKGEATGSMSAKVWKGNHKYYYEWYAVGTGNALLNSGIAYDTSVIRIDNRIAGNYLLRVQDTAGCSVSPNGWLEKMFTLSEPTRDLSISVVRNRSVSCNGNVDGEIEVKGVGGWGNFYTYGLDALHIDQSGTFSNLLAGTITVFAKDTSGTSTSLPVTILQPYPLTASVASKADATCYNTPNGSVLLAISGGNNPYYKVSENKLTWFKGTTVQNLFAGNYSTFYVRDTLGCAITVNSPVNIGQPPEMIVADTVITKTRCSNAEGSIVASITGGEPGYNYSWSDPNNNALTSTSNSAFNLYSGTYQLHVLDALQCLKTFSFDVWDITDLTIDSVATKPVSCWGYSDGKASVYISKGTPPYVIQWPDNSSSTDVSGLQSKTYDVRVFDDKNCKTHQNFIINTPDSISLYSVTRSNPLCEGYGDGSLNIVPTGSFGGYSYQWENGEQTSVRKNLLPGTYHVTVTDSHNCFNRFALDMWYQRTIHPSMGNDFTLCKGNNSILNPGVYDVYQWFSNNNAISRNPQITVDQAGTYSVQVKDNNGCIGHDTITIGQSATLETGKLLIATSVEQHDTVMVFQESWPTPDSVKFDLSGCTILSGDKYYREVIFADTGTYTIGLTSYLNDCRDVVEKQIRVEPKSIGTLKSTSSRLIQAFTLSPNPNSGHFKAEIRLRETADIVLQVANISNGVIMDIREFKGSDIYTINYNLNLPSGTYLLYLQAGKEAKTRTFVIQK
jgi:large repetitive protein